MQPNNKRDFNAVAATWDEEPRRVLLAQDITAAILKEVPLSGDMTALDYGCGSGLVTLGIQPHVKSIIGADSSQGMLEVLAQKVAGQRLDNVSTRLIDATLEPLKGNFDLIVSSMTMHHVPDVAALVSTLMHSLNPGGWLALADLEVESGSFHDNPTGVFHHGFEADYVQGLLTEKGCADVRLITAASMTKATPDGGERHYPVFLAVGRKYAKSATDNSSSQ